MDRTLCKRHETCYYSDHRERRAQYALEGFHIDPVPIGADQRVPGWCILVREQLRVTEFLKQRCNHLLIYRLACLSTALATLVNHVFHRRTDLGFDVIPVLFWQMSADLCNISIN